MELLQIIVPLIIFMLLVVPMGKYVYCVATGDKAIGDNFLIELIILFIKYVE